MKKGAVPQLDAGWWKKNKAKTLKSTGLGKVLRQCVTALDKAKATDCNKSVIEDAINKLDEVESTARTIANKKCNKKIHAETIAALLGYKSVVKNTKQVLQKRVTKIDKAISEYNTLAARTLKFMQDTHKDVQNLIKQVKQETAAAMGAKKAPAEKQISAWLKICKEAPVEAKKMSANVMAEYKKVGTFVDRHPHLAKGHLRDVVLPKQRPLGRFRSACENYKDGVQEVTEKLRIAAMRSRRHSMSV